MIFGSKIKELREKQGLLKRQLAVLLEIDTPMHIIELSLDDRRSKPFRNPDTLLG